MDAVFFTGSGLVTIGKGNTHDLIDIFENSKMKTCAIIFMNPETKEYFPFVSSLNKDDFKRLLKFLEDNKEVLISDD